MSDGDRPKAGERQAGGGPALDLFGSRKTEGSWVWLAAAGVLTVLWLGGAALFAASVEGALAGAARVLLVLLVTAVPVGLIWAAIVALQAALSAREQAGQLQATVDAMRQAYVAEKQAPRRAAPSTPAGGRPQPERAAPEPSPALSAQPALGLEMPPAEQPEIAPEDFIRALDFPASPEDREGFRALRRARADRRGAGVIQASQDLLTLLSEDGLYMDDFAPDRARPDVWRRFARGERGRSIGALGGIHDSAALEVVGARLREDAIFRDTVHHFLRRFDRSFAAFEERASDAEISALADTRSARAFMLVGRVAGIFG